MGAEAPGSWTTSGGGGGGGKIDYKAWQTVEVDKNLYHSSVLANTCGIGKNKGYSEYAWREMVNDEKGKGFLEWLVGKAVQEHGMTVASWNGRGAEHAKKAAWALRFCEEIDNETRSGGIDPSYLADDDPLPF